MAKRPAKNRLDLRKEPLQARSADTLKGILEAAARILEEKGLQGYNTNEVAARAGVSIGSLYQYFPNKDAIMKALVRRETDPMVSEFKEMRHALSVREGLRQLIRAAVSHQLQRPALAKLLDFAEARLRLDKEIQNIQEIACAELEHLLIRGEATAQTRARIAAQDVFAIVRGMVDSAGERGERDRNSLEERVQSAVFGYLVQTRMIDVSALRPKKNNRSRVARSALSAKTPSRD
jgi:AcrR family transcriptional regulator